MNRRWLLQRRQVIFVRSSPQSTRLRNLRVGKIISVSGDEDNTTTDYHARWGRRDVIATAAKGGEVVEYLNYEVSLWKMLRPEYGISVPQFIGYFQSEDDERAVMIVSDEGPHVETLHDCKAEVYNLLQRIHKHGIYHDDIRPCNVLRNPKDGRLRLANLHESVKHDCNGDCGELRAYAPSTDV